VQTFYGGVKNSKGELIFSGQALGNPIPAMQPNAQGPGGVLRPGQDRLQRPQRDWQKFDLDRDMKYLDEKIGYVDAVNPDLSKFKKSGGKLLLTHGWSDTGITPETPSGTTTRCCRRWARTRATGCGCSWPRAWAIAAAAPA
jgi:hypothetical protein